MARRAIPSSRMYQATLPAVMHDALRREAVEAASKGGQVNLNKVVVQRLYASMQASLSPLARKTIEDFIRHL